MIELNTLVPANSGWGFNVATAINDSGHAVGIGSFYGYTHAIELTLAT